MRNPKEHNCENPLIRRKIDTQGTDSPQKRHDPSAETTTVSDGKRRANPCPMLFSPKNINH